MKLYLTKEKKELYIKTLVWNSLVDFFKKEKDLEIEKFLVSVKLVWKKIIVTTKKPIFNSEAILFKDKIFSDLKEKFEKIDLDFAEFEVIFK